MRQQPKNTTSQSPLEGSRARRSSMWRFSAAEVTVILGFGVATLWITMALLVPARQPVLGGDFMVFYTFGTAARLGDWTIQYDWPAFHALQVSLIPQSDSHTYPPSYPPLVPALYGPFSLLPFPVAYAAWVVFSAGAYGSLMAIAARGCVLASQRHVLLACLLFPPFVAHEVVGQSTIWPLAGFVCGWWALTQSKPLAGGLMLSAVAIKPHLGMALAIVLLAMRLWRTVAGVLLGLTLQIGVTLAICGTDAVAAYLTTTLRVLRDISLIEPKDARFTHALRMSLESLLPHGVATAGWFIASGLFGWMVVRVWRHGEEWTLRMAALLLATLLISPHVQAYDAILLAPAALWLICWAVSARQPAVTVGVVVLSIAFVVPSARLWGIPLTLPLMAWLLWRCQREVERSPRPADSTVTNGSAPVAAVVPDRG